MPDFHNNNREAKAFYEMVMEEFCRDMQIEQDELRKIVDSSVYSTTQQFRMMGSSKLGKRNWKNPEYSI